MDAVGVTMPLPTTRGSIVLSFGYHRVRSFGGTLSLQEGDTFVDYTITVDSVDYTLPFEATLSGEELQEGELSQTSFGGSLEIAPDVFVGGAVNFWSGTRDYSWRFTQVRGIYEVENLVVQGDLWEVMLPDIDLNTHYQEKYSGFNLTFGVLMKTGGVFQVGGVVKTPVTLTGKREWDYMERETVYPGYEEFQQDDIVDSDFIDHRIQSPWVFRLGGAVKAGPLMISGDVELNDYSQMRYKTAPPEGTQTMSVANREIRRNYRSTLNYHVGGEFTLPGIDVRLRGGYGMYKSPLADAHSGWDRKVLSFGAGIPFGEQFTLDVAYAQSSWDGVPDDIVEVEKIEISKVLVTLSYRKKIL